MQLELHALALSRRLHSPVRRLSYLYLGPSVMQSAELPPGRLDEVRWELLTVARKVRRERHYRPRPGRWCGNCDFRTICPRGAAIEPAAGSEGQLELWDDLANDWTYGGRQPQARETGLVPKGRLFINVILIRLRRTTQADSSESH
jgi:hypothetical protein